MWRKVGVVRNGEDLQSAVGELKEIRNRAEATEGSGGPVLNAKWNEAINVQNMVVIAEMIAASSLIREESRGAHYRQDFPEKNVQWLKNICMKPTPAEVGQRGDGLQTWTTPVKFTRLTPPEVKEAAEPVGAYDK
jgi:succinate dehydrogenase/fumarate reductase flavoprotein subunit